MNTRYFATNYSRLKKDFRDLEYLCPDLDNLSIRQRIGLLNIALRLLLCIK